MCTRKEITIETYMGFFGGTYSSRIEKDERLDRDDCLSIVNSNLCDKTKMRCSDGVCKQINEPTIQHKWLTTLIFRSHHCFFTKIRIRSRDLSEPVYIAGSNRCLPYDKVCTVDDKNFCLGTRYHSPLRIFID